MLLYSECLSFVFSRQYRYYAQHVLRFFNDCINVYTKQSYARLSFEKYIDCNRAMDKICKEIVQGGDMIVFVGEFQIHFNYICVYYSNMFDIDIIIVASLSGATNFAPNSPIKGYRKTPNADKFMKYINRRPRCYAIPVNEHRSTMICNTCRTRNVAPDNPKQRYRVCFACADRTDLELLPPTEITTFVGKRKLKKLRKIQREQRPNELNEAPKRFGPYRPIELPPRSALVSKIVKIVKNDRTVDTSAVRKNKVWNRDVNAGRNILCIGLYDALNSY